MGNTGTVFAYGVTSSGKTHTMHVSLYHKMFKRSVVNLSPVRQ